MLLRLIISLAFSSDFLRFSPLCCCFTRYAAALDATATPPPLPRLFAMMFYFMLLFHTLFSCH